MQTEVTGMAAERGEQRGAAQRQRAALGPKPGNAIARFWGKNRTDVLRARGRTP